MRYEREPTNCRKSFYGKCYVEEKDGVHKLYSYDTLVMSMDADKNLHRYWDGESATTMAHIRAFVYEVLGIEDFPIQRWRSMEVEKE